MLEKLNKIFPIIVMIFVPALVMVCSAEEDTRQEGLFSKGSFLSEAIGSAANKLNNVASGGERIVNSDAKGIPQDTLEYDGNPLGRPLAKPSFRNKGGQKIHDE